MEWFDPMTIFWAVVNQVIGYAICWFYGVRHANRELQQLKSKARTKVQSLSSKCREAEELRRQLEESLRHPPKFHRGQHQYTSRIRRTKE